MARRKKRSREIASSIERRYPRRGGSEVEEDADGDFMPIHEEDGPPLDYGDADHDEDERQGIVAECAQQGR